MGQVTLYKKDDWDYAKSKKSKTKHLTTLNLFKLKLTSGKINLDRENAGSKSFRCPSAAESQTGMQYSKLGKIKAKKIFKMASTLSCVLRH